MRWFVERFSRLVLICASVAIWRPAVSAETFQIEDFENGTVAGFDPFFNYELLGQGLNGPAWEIMDDFITGSGHLLFGSGDPPITVNVTFNLAPGEYVDYVAIDIADRSGFNRTSGVRFIGPGSTAAVGYDVDSRVFATFDTAGLGLSRIDSIQLLGNLESHFDNITVRVVPEPAAATLLATGLAWMTLRRRGRRTSG